MKDDLDHSHFAPHNVRFDVLHVCAKYQVAIYNSLTVMANVKVGRKQTNQPTNNQTVQTQYVCPQYKLRDIKARVSEPLLYCHIET